MVLKSVGCCRGFMFRVVSICVGLFLGTAASQLPEFSQQYLQRLGGAVDELGVVTGDFDASAADQGLTRAAALAQMQGAGFSDLRRQDMERSFARYERLATDLAALRSAVPGVRPLLLWRMSDPQIARRAWADYAPAVPVTMAGLGYGGAGFVLGAGAVGMARRRKANAPAPMARPEPTVSRGRGQAPAKGPRPGLPLSFLTRTNGAQHKVVQDGAAIQTAVIALPYDARLTRPGGATDSVLICVEGRGLITASGVLRTFEVGELVTVPPSVGYELRNTGDGVLRACVVEPFGS